MKKLLQLKNPWFWFFLLIILYSIWDYYEHISRPNADFGDRPWHWLGFTMFLIAGDIFIMICSNQGLNRLVKRQNDHLLIQLISVALAVFAHIYAIGPLAAEIFWSGSNLGTIVFHSPWQPAAMACAIFLTVRVLHFIISKILKRA